MTGISRRAFLGSAVLTAAATVAGCGSAEREAIDRLRRGFDGRLLLGGEAGWLDLALASAQRYASTPRLIADCASESDVRRAYAFAREHDWPFAVRGGGHSYAGFSCTDGLLICTRGLDRVEVNPRLGTITVGAGALLGPMLESLRTSGAGLIIPVGRCNGVGIAGLTLGGGWGFWSRMHGLTADSLVSTRLMTPDGNIRRVGAGGEPDLFWALRGGGGGNFGINTSFTFRAVPVPQTVTVFQYMWMDQAVIADVIQAAMDLAASAPRELSMEPVTSPMLNFALADSDVPNPVKLTITGQFTGPKARFDQLIGPLITDTPPRSQESFETDFWTAHQYLADSTPVGWFSVDSGFMDRPLSRRQVEHTLDWARRWPGTSVIPDSNWGFFSMGGAVSDVPSDATAFFHRQAQFLVKLETTWDESDSPSETAEGLRWLDGFARDVRATGGLTGAYVNFGNRDLADWARAYYGRNLERLIEVKRRWDPEGAFRFPQGIPLSLDAGG